MGMRPPCLGDRALSVLTDHRRATRPPGHGRLVTSLVTRGRLGFPTEAIGPGERDGGVMTMYLSNTDLHPTGSEIAEFIEVPSMRLDAQTRLNITRWAHEYISGLVENHHGGPEDVRSIIHQLHDERIGPRRDGSL